MDFRDIPFSQLITLLEASDQATFIKGLDGRYLSINAAGAAMLNRVPKDVLGKSDFELFEERSAKTMRERDSKIYEATQPENYDSWAAPLGSDMARFRSTKAPCYDSSGALVGLWGISRLVVRDDALVGSGPLRRHNLLTPLTSLKLRLELTRRYLAEEALTTDRTRELLEHCGMDADRMTAQVMRESHDS